MKSCKSSALSRQVSGKRTKAGFEPPMFKITRNGSPVNSTLADWRRPSFWSWRACVIKLFVWVGVLLQTRQTVAVVLGGVVDFPVGKSNYANGVHSTRASNGEHMMSCARHECRYASSNRRPERRDDNTLMFSHMC